MMMVLHYLLLRHWDGDRFSIKQMSAISASDSVDDYEMRPGRATTSAFRSNQERVLCDAPTGRAARRLQSLINCDSGGRAYDIISNHRKPLRPTIGDGPGKPLTATPITNGFTSFHWTAIVCVLFVCVFFLDLLVYSS